MAERRMFSKTIVDSDAFLDLPLTTQSLYFHLSVRADDDGFINNPKKIQRMIGASDSDMQTLIANDFIIRFDSGVVVIRHWKMHNYIQKDRYHETIYQAEKACLTLGDNNVYTLDTNRIHGVSKMEAEVSIGKDSIGKVSQELDKGSVAEDRQSSATTTDYQYDLLLDEGLPFGMTQEEYRQSVEQHERELEERQFMQFAEFDTRYMERLDELQPHDIQQIVTVWNDSRVTRNITFFDPLSQRANNTRLCFQYTDSFISFLEVIRSLVDQAWFVEQAKSGRPVNYDWFCKPDNFLKIVEGNYSKSYKADAYAGWET